MRFVILAQPAILLLASVGLVACSDPVPPTPQGAWSVNFQPQNGNITGCLIPQHNASVGSVTQSTKEKLVANGMSEAGQADSSDLSCSVTETATGSKKFNVDASMTQFVDMGQNGLHINVQGITAAATVMAPASGSASFSSFKTGGNSYNPPQGMPCQFYFIPNTGEGVAAGRIWVAFACPAIADASSGSTCELKESFAIFENCGQGAVN